MKTIKINKEIELLLGSFGAIQSAFLAVYIFFGKKHTTKNSLLTLFFFLITIRIIKSLLWAYLDILPDWFMNLGFIAHYATGPALFLYILHFTKPIQWNRVNYAHFIPAMLLLPFVFEINENNFWYAGGYSFLLYHQLVYTILTLGILLYSIYKKTNNLYLINTKDKFWLIILFIGTASIQLAYFSNYILGLTPYLAGPILYAVFIYIIAFYGFLNQDIYDKYKHSKYQNINIADKEFLYYQNEILRIMQLEKPFLNSSFTIHELSKQISLPSYLTSHIINKGFQTNFSDFANCYRIKEAESKLKSPSYNHIKIAEIAYECGFNTLSSFNTTFKKVKGSTPSQFKKSSKMQ